MDRPDDDDDVLALAASLYRLLTWARRISPPAGISATAASTIDTLSYLGPRRVSELADREGVTQPAMTTLINKLEGLGYAERRADPRDGRAALVRITSLGQARLDEARAARARVVAEQLALLPADDRASLRRARPALDRLVETGASRGPATSPLGQGPPEHANDPKQEAHP